MRMNFQMFPASAVAKFDCPSCGKKARKRTFHGECTCNPFNKNEDGTVKSPTEVRAQSKQDADSQRKRFMVEPLCLKCEDGLAFKDRAALFQRRRIGAIAIAA